MNIKPIKLYWYKYEIYRGNTLYVTSIICRTSKKRALTFLKKLYPNDIIKIQWYKKGRSILDPIDILRLQRDESIGRSNLW